MRAKKEQAPATLKENSLCLKAAAAQRIKGTQQKSAKPPNQVHPGKQKVPGIPLH